MSRPTKQDLLDAARAERQDDDRAKRTLDELLDGASTPLPGVEGPSLSRAGRSWILIGGLLVLLLLVGALLWPRERATPPETVDAGTTTPATTSVVVVEGATDAGAQADPTGRATDPLDAGVPTSAPGADAGAVASAPDAGPPPARPRATDQDDALGRELALLDQARVELAREPTRALATLDRHRLAFPRGALRLEADLLRVEALLVLDRKADATKLRRTLEKADTEGLVRDRLQRLFDQHP